MTASKNKKTADPSDDTVRDPALLRAARRSRLREAEEKSRARHNARQHLHRLYPRGFCTFLLRHPSFLTDNATFAHLLRYARDVWAHALGEFPLRLVRKWSADQWKAHAHLRVCLHRAWAINLRHRKSDHCFDHKKARYTRHGDKLVPKAPDMPF